jgi:hypothetical protein
LGAIEQANSPAGTRALGAANAADTSRTLLFAATVVPARIDSRQTGFPVAYVSYYNTGMNLAGPRRSICVAPLMAVFLLCFVAFLYPQKPTTGAEVSVVPARDHPAHVVRADNGAPGDGHPFAGGYPVASIEEAEVGSKQPAGEHQLSVPLLMAFLGLLIGLLLTGSRMFGRDRLALLVEHRLPSVVARPRRGPTAPLLEVFLL